MWFFKLKLKYKTVTLFNNVLSPVYQHTSPSMSPTTVHNMGHINIAVNIRFWRDFYMQIYFRLIKKSKLNLNETLLVLKTF